MTTSKTSNEIKTIGLKEEKVLDKPVVKEDKKRTWKDVFGIFSQFVMVGGDLV